MKREQVREIDRIAIEEYGIAGVVLMENAGRGCAAAIAEIYPQARQVTILCGAGNNGGDGYVIARHLERMDFDPRIVSLVELEKLRGDAAINASIAAKSGISIRVVDSGEIEKCIGSAEIIVDCLLGTGAVGPPRDAFAKAIQHANQADAKRIAIDLPSGLDCDTGEVNRPAFQAEITLTFVADKEGFRTASAKRVVGAVRVIDIGVPMKLLRDLGAASR
ncbi:MAG: NAD(P)H-hydrate epimerase [Planctomycetota bacterium]